MNALVKAEYQNLAVTFTEEAWFNATAVAEKFGKRPNDWLSLDETKAYLAALLDFQNTSQNGNSNPRVGDDCAKAGGVA